MGGLSTVLPDLIIMQWLMARYVPPNAPALLPAAWLGLLILCGRMTEGLSCPVVGHWSDTCRHRWGRRLPFLRLGILPYLAILFLLFNPPEALPQPLLLLWTLLLMEVYFFLYTAVFTPYLALLPEIAPESNDRVRLMTFQAVFIVLGTFVFAAMGESLKRWGWTAAMAGTVLLIAVFFLPVCTRVREQHRFAGGDLPLRLGPSLRLTLGNRPFWFVLASTSCYFYALNGVLLLIPYWVVGYLGGNEGDVTWIMAPYLLVNLACFFLFNALAPRLGKHPLLLFTYLGTGLGLAALTLAGHLPCGTPFSQSAVLMALLGIPMAGFMVLPYPVLSDVIDYDAQRTGRRREAVYFGVQGVAQKTAVGLSVLTFALLRYLAPDPALGLRIMLLCCAAACLAAALIFLPYPLREK